MRVIYACVLASVAGYAAAFIAAAALGNPGAALPAAAIGSVIGFCTPTRSRRRRP